MKHLVTLLLALLLGGADAARSWAASAQAITPEEVQAFLHHFEATAEQEDFEQLRPMVHEAAVFRFNDGDFSGRKAIQQVFEKTWAAGADVEDERFYLTDIQVLHTDQRSASATYTYNWEGTYQGQSFVITGRGTRVLVRHNGGLQIIHEHLSRFPEVD